MKMERVMIQLPQILKTKLDTERKHSTMAAGLITVFIGTAFPNSVTDKEVTLSEGTLTRLPGKARDQGRTNKDNRQFVDAVLWIARNGAHWREPPESFGAWHRAFQR
jgi:hypothetical protein